MRTEITKEAVDAAGGYRALARHLELTPMAVHTWKQVPAKWCLKVEEFTGVSRYDLREDIYGPKPKAEK